MSAERTTGYFVNSAELRPGGVLRIKWYGIEGARTMHGCLEVSPDDPDYEFWMRLKRHHTPSLFGPRAIEEEAVAKYREEFRQERA